MGWGEIVGPVVSSFALFVSALQLGRVLGYRRGYRRGLEEGADMGYRVGSKTALEFAAVLTDRTKERPS